MKTVLSTLLVGLFFALGCAPIDDVKTDAGECTQEFKTAYNTLSTDLTKLETLSGGTERSELNDKIEEQCAEFFEKFAASIECDGRKDDKNVKAKGDEFRQLCDSPLHYVTRREIPAPLD